MAQVQARQVIHAVPVEPALQDIADQHGVLDGRHADAVAGQDAEVVLGVLRHLQHRGRLEQGAQAVDRRRQGDLGQVFRGVEGQARLGLVGQGDVTGLARTHRQGDPHQPGRGRAQGVGLGIEGDDPRRLGAGDPDIQGRKVPDAGVGGHIHGLSGGGLVCRTLDLGGQVRPSHPPTQGVELHLLQEGGEGVGIGIGHRQFLEGRGQGRLVVQLDEPAGQADLVGELQEDLAALLLADFPGPGEQGLQVAVFVDQQGRGLHPDARGAGDIVHRVAAQGLDLHHLVRKDAELLDHLFRTDTEVLHGVEHGDALADQLHEVLVGGDDGHLAARLADQAGIGGDQVVGLEARLLKGVDAEGPGRLPHPGDLGHQVLGGRWAVGRVLGLDPRLDGQWPPETSETPGAPSPWPLSWTKRRSQ